MSDKVTKITGARICPGNQSLMVRLEDGSNAFFTRNDTIIDPEKKGKSRFKGMTTTARTNAMITSLVTKPSGPGGAILMKDLLGIEVTVRVDETSENDEISWLYLAVDGIVGDEDEVLVTPEAEKPAEAVAA